MRRRSRRRSPPPTAWSGRSWRSSSSGVRTVGSRARRRGRSPSASSARAWTGSSPTTRRSRRSSRSTSSGCWTRPRPRRRSTTCWESDDFDLLGDESGLLDVSDLPVRRQVLRRRGCRTPGEGPGLRAVRAAVQAEARRAARGREQASAVPRHGPHRARGVLRPQRRHAVHRRGRRDRVQEDDRAREQARTAPVHLRERHRVVDVPPVPRDQAERRGRPDRRSDRDARDPHRRRGERLHLRPSIPAAKTRRSPASRTCTRSASPATPSRSGSRTPRSRRRT